MVSEIYLNVIVNVAVIFLIISPMIRKRNYLGAGVGVVSFFALTLMYYCWAFNFSFSECLWKALRQTIITAVVAAAHSWAVNFDARRKQR